MASFILSDTHTHTQTQDLKLTGLGVNPRDRQEKEKVFGEKVIWNDRAKAKERQMERWVFQFGLPLCPGIR